MDKDPYKILQVSKTSSDKEIKDAYRRLAKINHPDVNPGNKEAEERFKELGEAYAKLSDPEKRKQFDMGADQVTNTATSQNPYNAYSIFNEVFKDDIKRYNKEREDYISFLDEMEPKFNQYDRTLKNEKETTINTGGSFLVLDIVLDSFSDKKSRIKKQLNDLERNVQAFDEFLIFFKEMQEKAKQFGFQFNVNQYTKLSQRGVLSANAYSNLKSQMKSKLSNLERKIKVFDEHMQFLDEMEERLKQYNKTIKSVKENAEGKRGKFSIEQIYAEQRSIRKELSRIEKNANAFDRFLEYYQEIDQKMRTLFNRKLINFDKYIDPKNRVLFEPQVFIDKQREIRNIMSSLNVERDKKVKHLREELEKRNLNFEAYLSKRNTDEYTVSVATIEMILKSVELIDQINRTLAPYEITIEEFLGLKGRLLIDMKYKDLLAINDTINDYINNAQDVNFEDVNLIDFEDSVPVMPDKNSSIKVA